MFLGFLRLRLDKVTLALIMATQELVHMGNSSPGNVDNTHEKASPTQSWHHQVYLIPFIPIQIRAVAKDKSCYRLSLRTVTYI